MKSKEDPIAHQNALLTYWTKELDRTVKTTARNPDELLKLTKRKDKLIRKIVAFGTRPNHQQIQDNLWNRIKDLVHYKRGRNILDNEQTDKDYDWLKFNEISNSLDIHIEGENDK